MEFTSGFLLSLSLCLDIGVANIAMITLAMQRGYFQGFCLGLGTCVGDLIYALLALAGMTVLLQYETVRWVLWIGGSALLGDFAAKMIYAALPHSALLAPAGGGGPRGFAPPGGFLGPPALFHLLFSPPR
ncbi:LysE family transporter, partial [Pseudomonas sp. TNT2022 ID357]